MCLNWFCFCIYYKGWSGYSTIGDHSSSSINIMNDKSSQKVEFDTYEDCSKLSKDENNEKTVEKTAAMVSQAEIWQGDKKFTVYLFYFYIIIDNTLSKTISIV